MNRVVVTGMGVISPIGIGVSEFWSALKAGTSGCSRVTQFDPGNNKSQIVCGVDDFSPDNFMDAKLTKRTSRFIQFAIASAKMAVEDAKIDITNRDDVGVYVGTGAGGFDSIDSSYNRFSSRGARGLSPFSITNIIPNMAASNVAIQHNVHGPCVAPVAACASGLYAVHDAYNSIRSGTIDAALAGATESTITSFVFAGYEALRVLSVRNDDPPKASRPFDKERDGFVMGEGAAILFLENYDSAVKRNAKIYGEVISASLSCDASHITSPDLSGDLIARTISNAVTQGGVNLNDIAYINAHGTSTMTNDQVEAKAIYNVFRDTNGFPPPVTAIKSMIGHTLGASGSLALAASLMSLADRTIPPTLNFQTMDENDSPLDIAKEQTSFKDDTSCVLTSAFGFGGHNACIGVQAVPA